LAADIGEAIVAARGIALKRLTIKKVSAHRERVRRQRVPMRWCRSQKPAK
jgi:hypothetical protein